MLGVFVVCLPHFFLVVLQVYMYQKLYLCEQKNIFATTEFKFPPLSNETLLLQQPWS